MRKLLFLFLPFLYQKAFSQTDTVPYSTMVVSTSANDPGDMIYNGREHVTYSSSIKGNPYFSSDSWQKGSIIFQNIFYTNVSLKYDLVADEVIIIHPNISAGVVLFTPRVRSFSLEGKLFIYLSGMEEKGLKTGIYHQAVTGTLSLYIRHSKMIEENIVDNALEKKITSRDAYFVLKNGQYHPVRKQKDIIDLIQDKKKEINSLLKSRQIRYKDDPEHFLVNLIQHYNQLNP
jgi:hypothetical protein